MQEDGVRRIGAGEGSGLEQADLLGPAGIGREGFAAGLKDGFGASGIFILEESGSVAVSVRGGGGTPEVGGPDGFGAGVGGGIAVPVGRAEWDYAVRVLFGEPEAEIV